VHSGESSDRTGIDNARETGSRLGIKTELPRREPIDTWEPLRLRTMPKEDSPQLA